MPKDDIANNDYDLSINRYKEVVYDEVDHAPPSEILDELAGIEEDILKGIEDLKALTEMTSLDRIWPRKLAHRYTSRFCIRG